MSTNTAPQRPTLAVGETRLFSVSFVDVLDSGETLTGTPTVVDNGTSGTLTIASASVNSTALTILGESVAIGQAVQFKVSGQALASSPYTLKITVSTTSSPAQTLVRYVKFTVEGP